MLMPKKNRVSIYEYLFKEGALVVMKDPHKARHPKIDAPNLHVMKALQSLKSRGYVSEQFAWRHHYYTLTNEGVTYLREFLHLPNEIVPSTQKPPSRTSTARPRSMAQRPDFAKPDGGERAAYRRSNVDGADGEKKGDVGPGAAPLEFRGGFGRGRGMYQ